MATEMLPLQERIRRELPSLSGEHALELTEVLERLIAALKPDDIYVFGSRARNDASPDSDIDLMLIVPDSSEPAYRRAQSAYLAAGSYTKPLDILVITRREFDERLDAPSSL